MYKTLIPLVYGGKLYEREEEIKIVEKDILADCLKRNCIYLVEEITDVIEEPKKLKTKKDKK